MSMPDTRTCLILNRLHEYPFLDELPDQWLDLLADLGQPVEYPAGYRHGADAALRPALPCNVCRPPACAC
jgi:hypothetical protein